jgi:hydrogenase large subunit
VTEAPRRALGHWLQITKSKISRYQIITPTCWNASPLDDLGQRGPLEQALLGTPVQDVNQPIEVLRIVHSFDPCLACAVHVMRPKAGARISTWVPEARSELANPVV